MVIAINISMEKSITGFQCRNETLEKGFAIAQKSFSLEKNS